MQYQTLTRIFAKAVETARLRVLPITRITPQKLSDYMLADDKEWVTFNQWDPDDAYDPNAACDHLAFIAKSDREREIVRLFPLRKADGAIAGELFLSADGEGHDRLSYTILPSLRRQGYGSEAYMAVRAIAEATGGFFVDYAETDPANTASIEFLRKAGFRDAGAVTSKLDDYKGRESVCFRRGPTTGPV